MERGFLMQTQSLKKISPLLCPSALGVPRAAGSWLVGQPTSHEPAASDETQGSSSDLGPFMLDGKGQTGKAFW